METTRVKLPAGRYVISDPCYVLMDDDDYTPRRERSTTQYGQFLKQAFPVRGHDMRNEFEIEGRRWACYSTAYGDGGYPSNIGVGFDVDAGCIACIPIELIRHHGLKEAYVHEFTEEFDCHYTESGGVIVFGDIEITTDEDPVCEGCGEDVDIGEFLCHYCYDETEDMYV